MEVNNTVAEAVKATELAITEPDAFIYTHHFKQPFSYNGVTHESLTFDWGSLTGKDHMAIENEILRRGKTLILPEWTSEFLCGMAVRACTNRNDEGFRVLSVKALNAMPIRDFQMICKRARDFLLRAGS